MFSVWEFGKYTSRLLVHKAWVVTGVTIETETGLYIITFFFIFSLFPSNFLDWKIQKISKTSRCLQAVFVMTCWTWKILKKKKRNTSSNIKGEKLKVRRID